MWFLEFAMIIIDSVMDYLDDRKNKKDKKENGNENE